MSYAAIITTKREILDRSNEQIIKVNDLVKRLFSFDTERNAYFITVKKEFYPPYYPKKNIHGMCNKDEFLRIAEIIDKESLIEKIIFADIGADNIIHETVKCYFGEFIEFVKQDNIKENVLYKILHYYTAYR